MEESTEGLLLVSAASTVALIRVLEEKGILQREDSQRLFDHAGLWLSELKPDLMSVGARGYASAVLDGMVQILFDKRAKPENRNGDKSAVG